MLFTANYCKLMLSMETYADTNKRKYKEKSGDEQGYGFPPKKL